MAKLFTEKLTLAPIGLRLNVDHKFTAFCLKWLSKHETEVETGKQVTIVLLGHKILFVIKDCTPEKSVVDLKTKLTILSINTRSDMPLEETGLNVFMTDEMAKAVLSNMIVGEEITEDNGIALWKEFKKRQSESLQETTRQFHSKVSVAKPNSPSLRSTIPQGIVAFLELKAGDTLEWKMKNRGNERFVTIKLKEKQKK